jgi:glycosyltransferase involved in cell wall biosynthesis
LSRSTTAVSAAAARRFIEVKAVPERKCLVVANGIDTVEFAPDPDRRARMRREMGAGNAFLWLTAGRIVPAKDYPNLLRAFALLRAVRAEARLWVAGEAAGAEFDRAIGLALEMGLDDSIRWLGLRRDLPALLDAADGFALGSAWEGMPLVLGEAMAMQKPIAATDVGGVRELLDNSGAIVPSKSPEALAEAMLKLMRASAEDRESLGRAARERIVRQFGMDAKADEWEKLYRAVLERKS